jgi:hypothetical protein
VRHDVVQLPGDPRALGRDRQTGALLAFLHQLRGHVLELSGAPPQGADDPADHPGEHERHRRLDIVRQRLPAR